MKYLTSGFKTTYTFALNGAVKLKETEVTPPGMDQRGGIDISTMRNTKVKTKAAKPLTEIPDCSATVSYDPNALAQIYAMIGSNQQITVTYPDTTTTQFWGFINKFTPNGMKEDDMPLADLEIVVTNTDLSGNEVAPTWPAS